MKSSNYTVLVLLHCVIESIVYKSLFFLSFVTALNGLAVACDYKGSVSKAEKLSRNALECDYQLLPLSYVNIGRGKDQLWFSILCVHTFVHIYAKACTGPHSYTHLQIHIYTYTCAYA